jgi:adenosylmethionine-8-amino-7-oxononanoate aminotransferase
MKPYSDAEEPNWSRLFQLGRGVFVALLGNSTHVDALSTWLLVTTGVATAFLLSHLAELAQHISYCYLRIRPFAPRC